MDIIVINGQSVSNNHCDAVSVFLFLSFCHYELQQNIPILNFALLSCCSAATTRPSPGESEQGYRLYFIQSLLEQKNKTCRNQQDENIASAGFSPFRCWSRALRQQEPLCSKTRGDQSIVNTNSRSPCVCSGRWWFNPLRALVMLKG